MAYQALSNASRLDLLRSNYDTLRVAGPVTILAPILGAVGLTLVTVSHLIPIAMGYELVPAYIDADPGAQASWRATADTFAAIAL
jgi:hypothetical protein